MQEDGRDSGGAGEKLIIDRIWAMPNKETFTIKPIKELIKKYISQSQGKVIDPFVRNSIFKKKCFKTNDLNPDYTADYHLKSIDFLKTFPDDSVDMVLYDPPYSPRQVKECYNGVGLNVFKKDTQMSFWANDKNEISRIIKTGGIVISCGWSSMGMGKGRGFEAIEILLVPHGGNKNDTIVTVERKC